MRCAPPPPIPRKMITKESASKQVTSLHSTIRVQVRRGEDWDKYFLTMPQPRYFIGTVRVEWRRWRWMGPLWLINAVISDHRRGAPSKFVKICCRNIPTEGCCYVLFLHGAIGHTGLIGVTTYFSFRLQSMQKLQIIQNILTIMCTISDFIWLSIVRSSWGAWVGNWSHFLVYNEDNLLVQIFLPVGKCQNYFPMKSH